MKSIIDRAIENLDTNIYVKGASPSEVDEFLDEHGWDIVQDYLAESRGDWSRTEYVSEYCPEFKITMQWNGWTNQVELVATRIEKENTLAKELKESLEIVLADKYAVVEHRDYDFFDVDKFLESQGWELYRATCIFQPGWCHYIYGNDNYPDIRLVLAWKVGHQIAALWTMDSNLIEDGSENRDSK